MNATLKVPPIDAALVQDALRNAGSIPHMKWIAQQLKLSEETLLPSAAKHFDLASFDMASLRLIRPDFNVVSFADCQRRACLVGHMHSQTDLTVVMTDPMDARLR
jgi:hypothetical protein